MPSSRPVRRPHSFIAPAGKPCCSRGVWPHRPIFSMPTRAARSRACLPLGEIRSRLFGHSLTSLPFAVYGGVAASRRCGARGTGSRGADAGPVAGRRAPGAAPPGARHPDWPTQDLYVTFRKAILPKEEDNMLAIPRKQRAMVRKGIKNGLHIDCRSRRRSLFRTLRRQRASPRHAGLAQALLPGPAAKPLATIARCSPSAPPRASRSAAC